LPIHLHAEVTIGARYLHQSVSCDVLGQGSGGQTAARRKIFRGSSTWIAISQIDSVIALYSMVDSFIHVLTRVHEVSYQGVYAIW